MIRKMKKNERNRKVVNDLVVKKERVVTVSIVRSGGRFLIILFSVQMRS